MARVVVLRPSGAARLAAKPQQLPQQQQPQQPQLSTTTSSVIDARVEQGEKVEKLLLGWALTNDGWTSADGDEKSDIHVFFREGELQRHPSPDNNSEGPKSYQIWKCYGEVTGKAEDVYRLMTDTTMMPRWNRDVTSYQVLEKINETTDFVQCVSAANAKGTVSPRDFVMLRRRSKPDPDTFVIADTGINHPKATTFPDGSVVRGWNGPGGIVIRRLSPTRCWVCWVLNKDLRGWLPRTLVDQVLATVTQDWIRNLRLAVSHVATYFPTSDSAK